jgi:hypothetical protein
MFVYLANKLISSLSAQLSNERSVNKIMCLWNKLVRMEFNLSIYVHMYTYIRYTYIDLRLDCLSL